MNVILNPPRPAKYDHVWYWRSRLPERKGQRCRVLVRGRRMNSVAVEFDDGFVVITSRYAVRQQSDDAQLSLWPGETREEFGF